MFWIPVRIPNNLRKFRPLLLSITNSNFTFALTCLTITYYCFPSKPFCRFPLVKFVIWTWNGRGDSYYFLKISFVWFNWNILQAERYVDRKLDQAESALKKKSQKAKKWYSALIGDENGPKINEFHIFLGAFVGGYFIGASMS